MSERSQTAEARRLNDLRKRVKRARKFPDNTCPASRHLYLIADALAKGEPYHMLTEEPQHCAETMLAVLASLWEGRTRLKDSTRSDLCGNL